MMSTKKKTTDATDVKIEKEVHSLYKEIHTKDKQRIVSISIDNMQIMVSSQNEDDKLKEILSSAISLMKESKKLRGIPTYVS